MLTVGGADFEVLSPAKLAIRLSLAVVEDEEEEAVAFVAGVLGPLFFGLLIGMLTKSSAP